MVPEGADGALRPHAVDDGGHGWSSELQTIVEEASRVLGRPMVLTDRQLRLLAYTKHEPDQLDPTRLSAIMKQPAGTEQIDWYKRHGLWSSERPFRIPANPELEYDPRVVAPIRFNGHHLGSLACTDRDETMSEADLDRLGMFAAEAASVLYREMLLADLSRSRERELLRDILLADADVRREAALQLIEENLFTPDGGVVVMVVPLQRVREALAPEEVKVSVEALLMRIRRQLTSRHALHLVRPDHALVVVSRSDPRLRAEGVAAFARSIHAEVGMLLPAGDDERRIVAVGGAAATLSEAVTSYQQALRAADAAATVSTFGDVVCWDDLGIYQILTELPLDALGSAAVHPGLRKLLEDPDSHELVRTLERYFDLGGDTQRTAASLYMHRTTLYHRLRRIESLAGVDLQRGDDRLALHLGLKLARLKGLMWSSDEPGQPTRSGHAAETG